MCIEGVPRETLPWEGGEGGQGLGACKLREPQRATWNHIPRKLGPISLEEQLCVSRLSWSRIDFTTGPPELAMAIQISFSPLKLPSKSAFPPIRNDSSACGSLALRATGISGHPQVPLGSPVIMHAPCYFDLTVGIKPLLSIIREHMDSRILFVFKSSANYFSEISFLCNFACFTLCLPGGFAASPGMKGLGSADTGAWSWDVTVPQLSQARAMSRQNLPSCPQGTRACMSPMGVKLGVPQLLKERASYPHVLFFPQPQRWPHRTSRLPRSQPASWRSRGTHRRQKARMGTSRVTRQALMHGVGSFFQLTCCGVCGPRASAGILAPSRAATLRSLCPAVFSVADTQQAGSCCLEPLEQAWLGSNLPGVGSGPTAGCFVPMRWGFLGLSKGVLGMFLLQPLRPAQGTQLLPVPTLKPPVDSLTVTGNGVSSKIAGSPSSNALKHYGALSKSLSSIGLGRA